MITAPLTFTARLSPSLLSKLKDQSARYAFLCISVILIGAAFRLSQYVANRSLFIDEAALALNIIHRSFLGLAQPLDYDQGAPLGFLFFQKLLTVLFGNRDYVLRIFPLLCGLSSIWVMYELAKRVFVERVAVFAAVLLFAVSDRLIYYASDAKQYSSDVLICLVLLLAIVCCLDRNLSRRDLALLAVLGASALWMSHPALFILAGTGCALSAHFIWRRNWRSTLLIGCLAGFWLVNFIVLYFVSLRELSANDTLLAIWNKGFMPLPPWREWQWFVDTFRSALNNPIGLAGNSAMFLASAIFLAIGVISLCLRRWELGLMLLLPVLLTLIASALHKYPFSDRLLLFLVPIVFLIIAETVGRVCFFFVTLKLPQMGLPIALMALTLLVNRPSNFALRHLSHPRMVEEIKPMMAYLSAHRRENDAVYINYSAAPAYLYYSAFYDLADVPFVQGSNRQNTNDYSRELSSMRGRSRVWILFSHAWYYANGVTEETLILKYLDQIGTRLDQRSAPGSQLYLYDLSLAASVQGFKIGSPQDESIDKIIFGSAKLDQRYQSSKSSDKRRDLTCHACPLVDSNIGQ
jgi:hypothetical protein